MSKTPDNIVLTNTHPHHAVEEVSRNLSADFPLAVYHVNSQPGALITQLVHSAEERQALGKEWVSLKDLNIETAPAAEGN
jgi:hypothetical protein